MLLVARVDTFRRISCKEIFIEYQTRNFFYNRDAIFFSSTWINSRFINNDISFFENLPYCFACFEQRSKIWPVVFVNRSREGNNKVIAVFQFFQLISDIKTFFYIRIVYQYRFQQFSFDFQSAVYSQSQFMNSGFINIKSNGFKTSGKETSERKPHITQSNDSNSCIVHILS